MFLALITGSEYWESEIDDEGIDKTSSVTHHELFKKGSTPFGLENDPGAFECAMDVRHVSLEWQHKLVYIGNNFILLETSRVHLKRTDEVLRLLMKAYVKIAVEECVRQ